MNMYVIINEDMYSDGLWEIGIKRSGFAYASPELAVLINPIYETFDHPRIFEASGEMNDPMRSDGEFTLLRETYVPEFTLVQRQWFAIQCALAVCDDPVFVSWANAWINGTDRSSKTAQIVSGKFWADHATRATHVAVADAAANAAACAVDISDAAYAANATILAADAAYYAAEVNPSINFTDIAANALNFDLKEFQEIDF
jgi:hypothetical protein